MLDFVLNFLFPPVCGICGKLDSKWLCEKCRRRLEKYERFEIIKGKEKINKLFNFQNENCCDKNNESNFKIDRERIQNLKDKKYEKIYFDEFFYCFEYKNLIRNLLLKYKFSDCAYLSNLFANVILNNKKINEIFEKYDIMIPVPMDKNKKAKRGYNQTELMVKVFEKNINFYNINTINNNISSKNNLKKIIKTKINLNDIKKENAKPKIAIDYNSLIKIKQTKTQSTLKAEERTKNIENAFCVKDIEKIQNKRIILFDDIATTGSTVNEISKVLKNAGARKILVLVIAKD